MSNLTVFRPLNSVIPNLMSLFNTDLDRSFPMLNMGFEHEPRIRLDVAEDDKTYTIKAEIPGVDKEDIKISVEGDRVSIWADVNKETKEQMSGNLIFNERYYGSASRTFTLGHSVDDTNARAKYENGVLNLTLPKKEHEISHLLPVL